MDYKKLELTTGILAENCKKVKETLIYKIDPDVHASTYIGVHADDYAEPEFTGKYLDLCMKIYRTHKDITALKNAEKVVNSILENQRADGYLGCLPKGKETVLFSVWNQSFTIFGLLSYYREIGDKKALEAATKCVDYVMNYFIEGGIDILDAPNYGTQHISILLPLCQLYEITKDEKCKKYILYIVERIKNSDLNFFDFENILALRSRKGIENFVILLGILCYARLFNDEVAVTSVEKYWTQVRDTQIRNTGNGTVHELWSENGNGCMLLGAKDKPNENCVAVGWIELSLALFYMKHDVKYLNAIDKTLYNHLLASISADGSDFAYYQPNYGKKIKATDSNMYKCCRYRGFTIFAYMDEMLYYEDDQALIPMIYTSSNYCSAEAEVVMESDYPYKGAIKITTTAYRDKALKLRVPERYSVNKLLINGREMKFRILEGYINIELLKNVTYEIELILEPELVVEEGFIDDKKYVAFSYGCILLAAKDVIVGTSIKQQSLYLKKISVCDDNERFCFSTNGCYEKKDISVIYCAFSDADNYSVWMPVE